MKAIGYRRVLLFGGASEIGQQILAALRLPPDAEVLLAGRDEQRMATAAQALSCRIRTLHYDAAAEMTRSTGPKAKALSSTAWWVSIAAAS